LLIDPHVNPLALTPADFIQQMIEASIDGVVLTLKHQVKEALPYIQALNENDFIVFQGVELQLQKGSIVFIPDQLDTKFIRTDFNPKNGQFWSQNDAFALLSQFAGVVIAVHPYSRIATSSLGDLLFQLPRLDAIETRVGKGNAIRDLLCDEACKYKKTARIGSCSGDVKKLGMAVTAFNDQIESQADLTQAIRDQLCWPIEFENPLLPRDRYQGSGR
jgi:hypothetical protein